MLRKRQKSPKGYKNLELISSGRRLGPRDYGEKNAANKPRLSGVLTKNPNVGQKAANIDEYRHRLTNHQ